MWQKNKTGRTKHVMKWVIGLFLISSGWAFAGAGDRPGYFGPLKGEVFSGLTDRETFDFSPGELGACEKKILTNLITFKCPLQGTAATVAGKDRTVNFTFDQLFLLIHTKGLKDMPPHRDYIFWGKTELTSDGGTIATDVKLTLSHDIGDNTQLFGTIEVPELQLKRGLHVFRK
jgi:hypothetical protein